MPVRRIDPYRDLPSEELASPGVWIGPPSDESPGVWAFRLRFSVETHRTITVRFDATGSTELFLDSERIVASGTRDPEHYDASEAMFELDLAAGRHELFAYLWSLESGETAPSLAFRAMEDAAPIATGTAPWKIASLRNIEFLDHPRNEAYRITGEPTGPGGMDRGAEWRDPVIADSLAARSSAEMVRTLSALASEEIEVLEVTGGSQDEFASIFGLDGQFGVAPGEIVTVLYSLPRRRYTLRLRSSGGAGSSIGFDMGDAPEAVVTFEPRGFRQDFSSFTKLLGGTRTLTLNGGERGMALFRLEFWD